MPASIIFSHSKEVCHLGAYRS